MATAKTNDLTLAQKYEVIKIEEKEKNIGVRKLSQVFGCGKTQISMVIRNKERIKELYEKNVAGEICHTNQRFRESKYSEVKKPCINGFYLQCQKIYFLMALNWLRKPKKLQASLVSVISRRPTVGWIGGRKRIM